MSKPLFYHTDTGSTKSSAVYQSVPTLSSPALQAPHATSQPIDESLLPSRKKKLLGRVALVTAALTLCVVGPVIGWVYYVFMYKHTTIDWRKLVVKTTADPSQFLLVSTAGTTVAKIFAAPLLCLYAYSASADWIKSSAMGNRDRQPSPIHLASLLSLFQGASFYSLAIVSLSGIKGRFGAKRRQPAWPPMLKKVIALLVWILFLLYSLTAINIWLSIDAVPIPDAPLPVNMPYAGRTSKDTMFSRMVDKARCKVDADGSDMYCGGGAFNTTQARKEAKDRPIHQSQITQKILTNNSDIARVAWLEDNTAILVTSKQPVFGYAARALGVQSVCKSLTRECTECGTDKPDTSTSCLAANDGLVEITCPSSTGIVVELQPLKAGGGFTPIGPLWDIKGTEEKAYADFGGNPFKYADILESVVYFDDSLGQSSHFVGSTGFLWSPSTTDGYLGGAINIMSCEVSVYDVEYEFALPGNYTTMRRTLADATTASYVAWRLYFHWSIEVGRGFETIDGEGLSAGPTYPQLYGRLLSKIAIASTSEIITASPADKLLGGQTTGTSVTLIGMALLAAVLGLIIVTTIIVGVHASIVILRTDSKFLAAARGRLISVYPLIGDSFGGLKSDPNSHKPAVSAALDETSFMRESDADRLQLVQEPVDGGPADGKTVRLRPRRVGMFNDGSA